MTDLAEQGFEVITDENGEEKVKLVLVDENNESTGYVLVSPEEARQILAGNATIQNAPEESEEKGMTIAEDSGSAVEATSFDTLTKVINNTDSLQGVSNSQPRTSEQGKAEHEDHDINAETTGPVEQYRLTEQTVLLDSKEMQQVVLTDANGVVIDKKEGVSGERVSITMGNQMLEYLLQGPADNGEPIVTTLLVTSGDETEAQEGVQPESSIFADLEMVPADWITPTLEQSEFDALRTLAKEVARTVSEEDSQLIPEPYHKRLGSYLGYQEMMSLKTYNQEAEERLDKFEMLRKHASLFRQASPTSRPVNKFEHIMNEAAAQICRYFPNLLFFKQKLQSYAKQLVKLANLENIVNDAKPSDVSGGQTAASVGSMPQTQQVVTGNKMPRQKTPLGDNTVHYVSNVPLMRRELSYKLSNIEEARIQQAVNSMFKEISSFTIKKKTECNNIERLYYDEALKLSTMTSTINRYDDDTILDMAAIHGRHANGMRNPVLVLTPMEVAVNTAAAFLVKLKPALLTHRKELGEFAKRAVRACGVYFKHTPITTDKFNSRESMPSYRLMGPEQIHDLDLSAAEQILSETLEYPETSSTDSEGFDSSDLMAMVCEENNNVLNETAIFCITGCDDLRRVRILNLSGCSFTSILPAHLNKCSVLVELNMENNYLRTLPRCLHLMHLKTLNLKGNKFSSLPLVEQFPRLQNLYIDDHLSKSLNEQVLAHFCPTLKTINSITVSYELTDASKKIISSAKFAIETMVQTKWEEDYAIFFKKGIPNHEGIKIIESLVLHVLEQQVNVDEPFTSYRDLLTRQIAEEFLNPKMLDEEEEEEANEKEAARRERGLGSDDEDDEEKSNSSSAEDPETAEIDRQARRMVRKQQKSAALQRKLAAEADENRVLLPDEPLDRVSSIVGQAMTQGKCVIYSVMRTAARQPGGELLIPVGGATTSNSNDLSSTTAISSNAKPTYTKAITRPPPKSTPSTFNKPKKTQPLQSQYKKITPPASRPPVQMSPPVAKAPLTSPMKKNLPAISKPIAVPTTIDANTLPVTSSTTISKAATTTAKAASNLKALAQVTVYDMNDADSESENVSPYRTTLVGKQRVSTSTPSGKVIRKVKTSNRGSSASKGRVSVTKLPPAPKVPIKMESEISPGKSKPTLVELSDAMADMESGVRPEDLPPPHEAPPSTLKMSTRVSNRNKRFSAYGVIDTSLAKEEAELRRKALEQAAVMRLAATNRTDQDYSDEDYNPDEDQEDSPKKRKLYSPMTASFPAKVARKANEKSLIQLSESIDYDPLHFIRCHARDNDPMDCQTKVWRCAFEPRSTNSEETTNVAATCGGECVCLIDCRTGKVMKRFKHQGEEFYTVAWTTVEMAAGHHTNILAAAGKLREIRLLHPEQLVCYAELKGHKDDIACMVFHPGKPTILFSGDAKACILVWDIGVPSAPEYRTKHQLLMRLECLRPNLNPVLNLIYMENDECLVAGCEDGVFVWHFKSFVLDKYEGHEPTFEIKIPTKQEPCFDGLAKLNDSTIVVKCVEEGEIFLIDFSQIIQRRKAHKSITCEVRGSLKWQSTDEIYINVSTRPNLSAIICGDNEGNIWLYDINQNVEASKKKFKAKPIKILEWPECSVGGARDEDKNVEDSISAGFKNPVVNATDMSSDGKYLVAVTDNNLVCIWKISS